MEDDLVQFQYCLTSSHPTDQNWLGLKIHRKSKHVARLWSQNLNGIKRSNNFIHFAENLEASTTYEIDYFTFTETNLNSSNSYVRDSIEAIQYHVLPSSRHILTSTKGHNPDDPFRYGGTLSIAHGKLSSRVASVGQDRYGRFSWTQFFGKKTPFKNL